MPTLDDFFVGQDASKRIFEAVLTAIENLGPADMRVSKSQIAFRCRRTFAWVWIPGRYLRGAVAPLVLTLAFRQRDLSPRWKEVVEPATGHFMHHLELYSAADVGTDVVNWLAEARSEAL